ncbi:MAG: hypothetical protein CMM95_01445 [Rickettsiales bacterium]|nr:hypothetical protein [Rickettsiales bacterium]|tara:strand:+ start:2393 stop:2917 length:525 start_codon:yes stop_codon:yes gene_type:complete
MISKYFQNYSAYYLSKYWVTKRKFENILKNKITKDFFQKKISNEDKSFYLNEISMVIKYYEDMGFFDEKKLIEIKLENLMNKGYSLKKIKYYLQKDYFNINLINSKISEYEADEDINEKLMNKCVNKSGILKKNQNFTTEKKINKILKKLLSEGFNYNDSIDFIKNRLKIHGIP